MTQPRPARRLMVMAVFSVCCLAGCGGMGGSESADRGGAAKTGPLPKLGDPMPPLDDDRLIVAPPAGWQVLPRSKNYLARFRADKREPFPTIIITVDDFESIRNVTAENQVEFGKAVFAQMQERAKRLQQEGKGDGKVKLAESIEPVKIGKFLGIQYARRVRTSEGVMDSYFLETVRDGRRYILELRDLENAAAQWKPHLYAVALGMQFPKSAAAEPAPEPKPDQPDEPKPEPKPEPQPEPKPSEEPKPEVKPEPKPEPQPEPKPEPKKPDKPKLGVDDF